MNGGEGPLRSSASRAADGSRSPSASGDLPGSAAGHRPTVWLDADPGHDDVFAILVALARAHLVGVSVVSGNAPLQSCLKNALVTLQLAGAEGIPVHAGAERPLRRPAHYAPHIHGESGLDGPVLPPLRLTPAAEGAVPAILAAAAAYDELWLVATGPLTNVALALQAEPSLAGRLSGISLMGGSYSAGNITAAAEFNIWADPDAAAAVFASGARIVMAGLDLTHQFTIGERRRQQVRAVGGPVADFTADLLEYFAQAYLRVYGLALDGPLHDPCAVLAVTDPQLFSGRAYHVAIETESDLTRGQTIVDRRPGNVSRPPTATVLEGLDDEAAFSAVLDAVRAASDASSPAREVSS